MYICLKSYFSALIPKPMNMTAFTPTRTYYSAGKQTQISKYIQSAVFEFYTRREGELGAGVGWLK